MLRGGRFFVDTVYIDNHLLIPEMTITYCLTRAAVHN